jgi:transcriptional regulator
MTTQKQNDDRVALLQGTLDLLILKTLVLGPCHGQGVARSILRQSEEALFVDHGSLYLTLQRLEDREWISAEWGVSKNNRRARFYRLTAKGREQLVKKTSEWRRLTGAMELILGGLAGGGEEALGWGKGRGARRILRRRSRRIWNWKPMSCAAKAWARTRRDGRRGANSGMCAQRRSVSI